MSFHQALITGATSGIGEALARFIADKGIPLILIGRNTQKLAQLKEEFSPKTTVITEAADLAKRGDRKRVVQLIHTLHPDLLVNCAGIRFWGETTEIPLDDQLESIEINVSALVELSIEGAKALMEHHEKGVILNIASMAGDLPIPNFNTYSATKAFVISFSKGMDLELESYGIRVLVSQPGFVNTPGIKSREAGKPGALAMEPDVLAKHLWKQIVKRKRSDIPDWRYFPLHWFSKIAPDCLKKKVLSKMFKAKKTKENR